MLALKPCPLCLHTKPHAFKIRTTMGIYKAGTVICEAPNCACEGVPKTKRALKSKAKPGKVSIPFEAEIDLIMHVRDECLKVTKETIQDITVKSPKRKMSTKGALVKSFLQAHSFSGCDEGFAKLAGILLKENVTPDTITAFYCKQGLAVVPIKRYDGHDYTVGEVAIFTKDHSDNALRMIGGSARHGNHICYGSSRKSLKGLCRPATEDEIRAFFDNLVRRTNLQETAMALGDFNRVYRSTYEYAVKRPTRTRKSKRP